MSEAQVIDPQRRATRSAGPLFANLAIAGAIALVGCVAQAAVSLEYDPIDLTGAEGCPDDAWPTVASVIGALTTSLAGVFVLAALTRIRLIWAAEPSEVVVRAVVALVLAAGFCRSVDGLRGDLVGRPGELGLRGGAGWRLVHGVGRLAEDSLNLPARQVGCKMAAAGRIGAGPCLWGGTVADESPRAGRQG